MRLRLKRYVAAATVGLATLILLIQAGAGMAAAAQADAQYGVYVQDEAGVLAGQTKDILYDQAIWLHEQTGTAQIGVVTVDDLGGDSLENFAVEKFRELGLGGKEQNDGVLLLYEKEGGHVRIEVGYGMEGRIPDGKAGAILDQFFVPNRDAGALDDAFYLTQSALIVQMAAEYGIDASATIGSGNMPGPDYNYGVGENNGEGFWSSLPWPVKAVGGIVIVLLIILDFKFTGGAVTWAILSMLSRGRGGGGGRGGGSGGGGSSGGGGASR